jgi:hypothetical protein
MLRAYRRHFILAKFINIFNLLLELYRQTYKWHGYCRAYSYVNFTISELHSFDHLTRQINLISWPNLLSFIWEPQVIVHLDDLNLDFEYIDV